MSENYPINIKVTSLAILIILLIGLMTMVQMIIISKEPSKNTDILYDLPEEFIPYLKETGDTLNMKAHYSYKDGAVVFDF